MNSELFKSFLEDVHGVDDETKRESKGGKGLRAKFIRCLTSSLLHACCVKCSLDYWVLKITETFCGFRRHSTIQQAAY